MNIPLKNSEGKSGAIILYVLDCGYNFGDELDLIRAIKENNIDISHYELPYGAKNIDEWEECAIESQKEIEKAKKRFTEVVNSGNAIFMPFCED